MGTTRQKLNLIPTAMHATRWALTIMLMMLMMLTGQTALAESSWTVTNNNGNSNTFTIKRNEKGYAQKVLYRTVGLTAYAGKHFTAVSGVLEFLADDDTKTVTVSELTPTGAYAFQNGTSRSYKLEVTDRAGNLLDYATRTMTNGTIVTSSGVFNEKSVTINSGEYTATDRGYAANGYKSVAASSYCTSGTQAYLGFLGAELRMTLSFDAKENDDGYQYLQLLVDKTSSCDLRDNASNGDPGNKGTPDLSLYMAGFEILSGSKDATYRNFTFPVTSVASGAGATNPWGHGTTGNNYPLDQQRFKSGYRATDGKLIIPTNFSSLVLRLNASGSSGSDEWTVKNVTAHIQAVETTNPTKSAVSVNPGRHAKGNTVYVSVAFSEIVTVTGTPKLTTIYANNWGELTYVTGSGTNVLTFSTTIPQDATGSLNITGLSGTVKDLAGNSLSGGVSASNLCTLDGDLTYTITDSYSDFYTDGSGNYLIACHDDLWGLASYVNAGNTCGSKTFLQVTDLKFPHTTNWNNASSTENNYTAIGYFNSHNDNKYFRGTYNGGGHTISGIRIYKGGSSVSDNSQGLFGFLYGGKVLNVQLADARITGKNDIGGIVGYNRSGTVEDCTVGADVCIHAVQSDAKRHGGIAGETESEDTYIQRCVSRATLTVADATGCQSYGGITGYNNNNGQRSEMSNCLVIGAVIPNVTYHGAIAGSMPSNQSPTRNYYHSCTVAGVENATNVGTSSGDITSKQGACALYAITLGTNVTLDRTPSATLPGTGYATYTNGADIAGVPYSYEGATITLGYSGEVNTGYHVEYSTTAGTISGSTLTMPAEAVTVSATVPANSYTVHFHKNDGGDPETTSDQSFTYNTAQALAANAFEHTGYTFAGWSTTPSGSVAYTDGQSVSNLTATHGATVDLYAQWTANTYTVTLDNQSATSAGTTSVTATYDAAMSAIEVPTRTGYTFGGYSTEINGGGTKYYNADGSGAQNWNIASETTLYAQWTAHTYTLRLHYNDGTDGYTDQTLTYDQAANIQSVSRTGYVFTGWSTTPSGSVAYTDGQSVSNLTTTNGAIIDLYAQWANPSGTCGTSATWVYNHVTTTLTISGSGAMTGYNADAPWENYKPYITTVSIGSGITTINGLPFANYSNLATVNGGEGLTFVNSSAFKNTPWLTAAKSSASVVYLGKVAFCGKSVSGDVTIKDGTVNIAGDAFRYNSTITSVTLPTSVSCIEASAFRDCTSLAAVNVLGSTPPSLNSSAFQLSNPDNAVDRTFNVRSASYKTTGEWAKIYTKENDYAGYTGTELRVVSTLALPGGMTASVANDKKVTILGTDYYVEDATVTLSVPGVNITSATYNDGSDHNATDNGNGTWNFTMPAADATVSATLCANYIDAAGEPQTATDVTLIQSSNSYQELGSSYNTTKWYAVSGEVTISGRLKFRDKAVHLILCDGATLTATSESDALVCGNEGSLTIYGQSNQSGTLTANNTGSANGIVIGGKLTINGGNVSGSSTSGNGIYVINGGDFIINRGNVSASGNTGINGSNEVTINGGTVTATGGNYGIHASSTITLGWTNPTDRIYASSYGINPVVKSGQTLYDGTTTYSGKVDKSALANKTLMGVDILLDDDREADVKNAARLAALNDGKKHNIMLQGRTLYRDGDWNTLCLPFEVKLALDMDNVTTNENHVFHGATVMMLNTTLWFDSKGETHSIEADGRHRSGQVDANGSLYLYFSKVMNGNDFYGDCIPGWPYIVKWGTKDSHPATDIVNPVFQNVTVTCTAPIVDYTTDEGSENWTRPGNVTFRGTFAPEGIYTDPATNLYLGAENELCWPKTEGYKVGAFRAYFALGNGLTAGESNNPNSVRGFNLNFGEEETPTGIINSQLSIVNSSEAGAWYSLDGRKLKGKPTASGIYINNGKKVLVRDKR